MQLLSQLYTHKFMLKLTVLKQNKKGVQYYILKYIYISSYHMNRCSRPSSSTVPSSALHTYGLYRKM